MHYIVGLGNPGEEYKLSRHNAGRIAVEAFRKSKKAGDFVFDKKLKALVCKGGRGKGKFVIILPETFMNKSGESVKKIISSKKKVESLIVIHDDIDLPLGKFKVSFGKGSGGHKGVESIKRAVKTEDFTRIRMGISPATPKGRVKKPEAQKILDFIIGNFKPKELQVIKKTSKKIASALEVMMKEGRAKAMSLYN